MFVTGVVHILGRVPLRVSEVRPLASAHPRGRVVPNGTGSTSQRRSRSSDRASSAPAIVHRRASVHSCDVHFVCDTRASKRSRSTLTHTRRVSTGRHTKRRIARTGSLVSTVEECVDAAPFLSHRASSAPLYPPARARARRPRFRIPLRGGKHRTSSCGSSTASRSFHCFRQSKTSR